MLLLLFSAWEINKIMDTLAQKWGSKLVGNLTLKDLQGREIYKLA